VKILCRVVIGFLMVFSTSQLAWGQCCSGGVPISSNLGLPASEAKVWQMSLSYDLNVLRTLKEGSEVLESGRRQRTTHSILYEVAYAFTDRFSVNTFFSLVRQERTIREFGNTDFVYSNGVGDAVFLARYKIIPSLNLGLGVKAPLGATDHTNDQGTILSADLQPGSGAWDLILWGSYLIQLKKIRPSATFSTTATYRNTGKNNDFRNGSQVYQFGNELLVNASFSDQFLIGKLLLGTSLGVKYRSQGIDKTEIKGITDQVSFPNSGGDFIFLNPGLTFHIVTGLNYQINADLPLWTRVDGTQLSPTYRINTGLYWRFGGKPKTIELKPNF